jgi:hypothetical protein
MLVTAFFTSPPIPLQLEGHAKTAKNKENSHVWKTRHRRRLALVLASSRIKARVRPSFKPGLF